MLIAANALIDFKYFQVLVTHRHRIAFENIVDVLQRIKTNSTDSDSKSRAVASGLLKNVLHFDFICSLFFTKNVMFKLKHLTESLESLELNIIDALKMIQFTLKSFEEMNNDNQINNLIFFIRKKSRY